MSGGSIPDLGIANPYVQQPMAQDDMTGMYNTALNPQDEAGYQHWIGNMSNTLGRDMTGDTRDYDMRGAWKGGAGAAGNGHFPDIYKKPNHPTFSNQSQYHGVDGYYGGAWGGGNGQPWTFTPGSSNLLHFTPNQLRSYFERAEPGNQLLLQTQGAMQ